MKTRLLITTILLFIATCMIATNDNVVRNKKHTESGSVEEITLYTGKSTTFPSKKSINKYDFAGSLQEKILYQWNAYTSSWQPIYKRGYSQNIKTNKLVITFTKWDEKKNSWSTDFKRSTYEHKADGMLSMAVEEVIK